MANAATIEHAGELPAPRQDAQAVTYNGSVYLFGGSDCTYYYGCNTHTSVVKIDPATLEATNIGTGPLYVYNGGAVAGDKAVLFGYLCGYCRPSYAVYDLDDGSSIVRPFYNSVVGRSFIGVNGSVYAVGGRACYYTCNEYATVDRFDPATGSFSPVGQLPRAVSSVDLATDGSSIFVAGQPQFQSTPFTVQEFDLATGNASILGTATFRLSDAAFALVNGVPTTFGGQRCDTYSCEMGRSAIYDLAENGTFVRSDLALPVDLDLMPAVSMLQSTLLLGGRQCEDWYYTCRSVSGILVYRAAPAVVQGLDAAPGAAPFTVDLSWNASRPDDQVTSYEIYRGANATSLALVATVDANTTTYADSPPSLTEPSFYAVKAVNNAGASPLSATRCAIPSPAGILLLPACALPADMQGHTTTTSAGEGADVLAVNGTSSGETYVVNATIDGARQPGVAVYDPSVLTEPVGVGTGAAPASARIDTTSYTTPAPAPCGLRYDGTCLAPLPVDPTRDRVSGVSVTLVLRAGDQEQRVETPLVPFVGEGLAALP